MFFALAQSYSFANGKWSSRSGGVGMTIALLVACPGGITTRAAGALMENCRVQESSQRHKIAVQGPQTRTNPRIYPVLVVNVVFPLEFPSPICLTTMQSESCTIA